MEKPSTGPHSTLKANGAHQKRQARGKIHRRHYAGTSIEARRHASSIKPGAVGVTSDMACVSTEHDFVRRFGDARDRYQLLHPLSRGKVCRFQADKPTMIYNHVEAEWGA